jgi:hypothetical protein
MPSSIARWKRGDPATTAIGGTKRTAIVGLAAAAALAIAPRAAAAPAATLTAVTRVDDSPTTHYLSLGDSCARGFQPNGDLTHGYAEQLYASLAADQPKLEPVKLGCGCESTVSMRVRGWPAWSSPRDASADDAREGGTRLARTH